jgi:HAD superfamily phosphoserine phosphatase-like hydrolase
VFVDFDGTITDVDTFSAVGRRALGAERWDALDSALVDGRMTLRSALAQQAAAVRLSRAEALAFLEQHAQVDPTFGSFVERVRAQDWTIRIVSCGIATLIEHALAQAGLALEVYANEVDFAESGWTMTFADDSDNGHDKARHVRDALGAGLRTVYIGDGISDFEAIRLADVRFVKAQSELEAYCRAEGIDCTPFVAFRDVERVLFNRSE